MNKDKYIKCSSSDEAIEPMHKLASEGKKREEGRKTNLRTLKMEYKTCDWVNYGFPEVVILKSKGGKTAIYRRTISE